MQNHAPAAVHELIDVGGQHRTLQLTVHFDVLPHQLDGEQRILRVLLVGQVETQRRTAVEDLPPAGQDVVGTAQQGATGMDAAGLAGIGPYCQHAVLVEFAKGDVEGLFGACRVGEVHGLSVCCARVQLRKCCCHSSYRLYT